MKGSIYIHVGNLAERIQERLAALGKTARGASLEAGLGASTIRNIINGSSSAPRVDTIVALAKVLDVDVGWFLDSALHPRDDNSSGAVAVDMGAFFERKTSEFPPPLTVDSYMPLLTPFFYKDLWAFERQKVYIERPKELAQATSAYAVVTRGKVMEPVYRDGDVLLVNPDVPVRVGEDHIFYSHETPDASIWRIGTPGRLQEMEGNSLTIARYGAETPLMRLDRSEFSLIHSVIGRQYRDG